MIRFVNIWCIIILRMRTVIFVVIRSNRRQIIILLSQYNDVRPNTANAEHYCYYKQYCVLRFVGTLMMKKTKKHYYYYLFFLHYM